MRALLSGALGLVLLLCAFLASPSRADEGEPLRFAAMAIPPYGFVADNQVQAGIFPDIFRALGSVGGFQMEIRVLPLIRVMKELETGKADCSLFRDTTELDRFIKVADVGWRVRDVVVARQGVKLDSYEDLVGKRVAMVRGSVFRHKVDSDHRFTRVETGDYRQSVLLLRAGRVDALVGTDVSVFHLLRREGIDLASLPPPLYLGEESAYIYCRPDGVTAKQRKRIAAGMKALIEEGFIEAVFARHVGPGQVKIELPESSLRTGS